MEAVRRVSLSKYNNVLKRCTFYAHVHGIHDRIDDDGVSLKILLTKCIFTKVHQNYLKDHLREEEMSEIGM